MRIAIVSFEGPGDNWIGAVRLRGLVNELQQRGDTVLLITSEINSEGCQLDGGSNHVIIKTPRILNLISYVRESMGIRNIGSKRRNVLPSSSIYRLLGAVRPFLGDLEREFFIPDSRVLWRPSATHYTRKLMANFQPDVIVSIGNPVSHMVAYDIKKCLRTKALWIAELQDPWPNHISPPLNPIARYIANRRETFTMALADVLVCATEGIEKLYLHPAKVVIPFGSEFEPMNISSEVEPFTIGYYGNLYKDRNRSASLFISALAELIKSDFELGHRIRFRIFNRTFTKKFDSLISHLGLDSNVIFENPIKRNEIFASMAQNHILVSFQGYKYDYAVASKIYDYIMTGRPILSVTPSDSCEAQFIKGFAGTGAAYTVRDIVQVLSTFLRTPAHHSYKTARSNASCYTQRATAIQFADLIHQANAKNNNKSS
jgi:hypothetical protein